jgi:hypothetical protein
MRDVALARAKASGKPAIRVAHGGSVPDSYNYPAETEACLVVAWPDGSSVTYMGTLPANKVTLSGVVGATIGVGRALFDARYNAASKAAARRAIIEQAEQHLWYESILGSLDSGIIDVAAEQAAAAA